MKKMLINATQKEEVRIALVEDRQLVDLDIEQRKNDNKKSNIYNGVISRVEPSLEACFVNYGEQRDGFLPFKDIHQSYYKDLPGTSIKDKLRPGQKIIVQVSREERGNKGAALTTYIAIASTFLVLMPKSPDVEGISRRLSGEERDNLRQKLSRIGIHPDEGVIVRTAGTGCTAEELKYDLDILHYIWNAIQEYARQHSEVGILHHESETIIRVIRDYLTKDVDEIITDSKDAFDKAEHYLKLVRPNSKPKLTYRDVDNLFSTNEYDIESQIKLAYEREVKLKSGGSIVIDTTEALTAIDVNSSRSTGNTDIESTAISTNLEAADEISRQLKIRDIGGLIVIDFIDMNQNANQRKVEERMKKATGDDRARIQLSKISKFGLMEVSRQRIRGSIAESVNHKCPRCGGTGFIRDNESIALQILRQANEEATRTGRIVKLHIIVPNEIAAYLLNEKRDKIDQLEQHFNIKVVIVPEATMETPHYRIYRVRKGDNIKDYLSYDLPDHYKDQERTQRRVRPIEKPEDKFTAQSTGLPEEFATKTFEHRLERAEFIKEAIAAEETKNSLFNRFKRWFMDLFQSKDSKPTAKTTVEEPNVTTKRKRRRNRKDRTRAETNTTSVKVAEPKVSTEAVRAKREDANNNRNNNANNADEAAVVRKQIKSGDTIEEVIGVSNGKQRKRGRKNRERNRLNDDIDPQEMKQVAEELEAAQVATTAPTATAESKPSRAERRRNRRAKELAPEYDYEYSEDLDDVTPAPRKGQRNQNSNSQAYKDLAPEVTANAIASENAPEVSLAPIKARAGVRNSAIAEAQSNSVKATPAKAPKAVSVPDIDFTQASVPAATVLAGIASEATTNITNGDVTTPANSSELTTANPATGNSKPESLATNTTNAKDNSASYEVVEETDEEANSRRDRRNRARRRRSNLEQKDLFLERVNNKGLSQASLNQWLADSEFSSEQADMVHNALARVPILMEVLASDGSVDVKERSPYRQQVNATAGIRKGSNYLGTINSEEFVSPVTENGTAKLSNEIPIALETPTVATLAKDVVTSATVTPEPTTVAPKANTFVKSDAVSKYHKIVFRAKQPCVNFNVDYDNVNRNKKRWFVGKTTGNIISKVTDITGNKTTDNIVHNVKSTSVVDEPHVAVVTPERPVDFANQLVLNATKISTNPFVADLASSEVGKSSERSTSRVGLNTLGETLKDISKLNLGTEKTSAKTSPVAQATASTPSVATTSATVASTTQAPATAGIGLVDLVGCSTTQSYNASQVLQTSQPVATSISQPKVARVTPEVPAGTVDVTQAHESATATNTTISNNTAPSSETTASTAVNLVVNSNQDLSTETADHQPTQDLVTMPSASSSLATPSLANVDTMPASTTPVTTPVASTATDALDQALEAEPATTGLDLSDDPEQCFMSVFPADDVNFNFKSNFIIDQSQEQVAEQVNADTLSLSATAVPTTSSMSQAPAATVAIESITMQDNHSQQLPEKLQDQGYVTQLNEHIQPKYAPEDEVEIEKLSKQGNHSAILATDASFDSPVEILNQQQAAEALANEQALVKMSPDFVDSLDEIASSDVYEASKTDTYLDMMRKVGKAEQVKASGSNGSRRVFATMETVDPHSKSYQVAHQANDSYLSDQAVPKLEVEAEVAPVLTATEVVTPDPTQASIKTVTSATTSNQSASVAVPKPVGTLGAARSYSCSSTSVEVEDINYEIPQQFAEHQSDYNYQKSDKSLASPASHASIK